MQKDILNCCGSILAPLIFLYLDLCLTHILLLLGNVLVVATAILYLQDTGEKHASLARPYSQLYLVNLIIRIVYWHLDSVDASGYC